MAFTGRDHRFAGVNQEQLLGHLNRNELSGVQENNLCKEGEKLYSRER